MSELTYTRSGDYLIPDLSLTEQPQAPLGKYGRMRNDYLKEHRPVLWNSLLLSEKLYPHLREIDEAANNRLEQMMPELMKSAGVTESLKASDPMKWVGLMNTLKAKYVRCPCWGADVLLPLRGRTNSIHRRSGECNTLRFFYVHFSG